MLPQPAAPHRPVGRLHRPGVALRIAGVGTQDAVTHPGAQPGQVFQIHGPAHRHLQIVGLPVHDPIAQPDRMQDGARDAAAGALAQHGDGRRPHPEGFPGGDAAIVGIGVQNDVHVVVGSQMLPPGGAAAQFETLRGDAQAGRGILDLSPQGRVV